MTVTIGRRELLAALGGAAAAWPLAARAQQPAMPVVGLLNSASAAEWVQPMAGFHAGLREMGFIEGRNVAIEYRWAEGQLDRMPAMTADLIGRKVAVILAGGYVSRVRATIAATQLFRLSSRPKPILSLLGSSPASINRAAMSPGSPVSASSLCRRCWRCFMRWCPRPPSLLCCSILTTRS